MSKTEFILTVLFIAYVPYMELVAVCAFTILAADAIPVPWG